jgi:hypothetical protein
VCSPIEGPWAPRVLVTTMSLSTTSGMRAMYSTPAADDWIQRSFGAAFDQLGRRAGRRRPRRRRRGRHALRRVELDDDVRAGDLGRQLVEDAEVGLALRRWRGRVSRMTSW